MPLSRRELLIQYSNHLYISLFNQAMRKTILFTSCVLMLLICCKQTTESFLNKYISTSNLPIQNFLINIARDTTIITIKGIKIFIPANSIESKNKTVTFQVKEALSLEDMIKAGLTTESDKGILSSDGMFYIFTKENAIIKKPLKISVPTFFADSNMRLYKGKDENGKLVWETPTLIDSIITSFTDIGKILFINHCASCHGVDNKLVGPALAWIDKRNVDDKTLHAFIRNPQMMLKSGNSYYNCLYCKYNKTEMTSFPILSDTAINAIIRYIDRESKRLHIPEDFNPDSECDSCKYYHNYYAVLSKTRDSLIKDNSTMSQATIVSPPDADPNNDNGTIPIKVSPPQYNAEYYQFKITAFGWYNVDDLVDIKFGAQLSELTVSIDESATERMNIFLVIPSYKVFNEGGLLQNRGDWGFYINNGKIYLPQKTKAFVFGIGEQEGKLYYGQTYFTTSISQHLHLKLNETNKDKMLNSFGRYKLDSLGVQVEKTKNFNGITKIDEELQNIRTKISQCSCFPLLDSDTLYYK
jgi:hypothetical protein